MGITMESHQIYIHQNRSETNNTGTTVESHQLHQHNTRRNMGTVSDADRAFHRSRVYELLAHAFGQPAEEFFTFLQDREFINNFQEALNLTWQVTVKDIEEAIKDVSSVNFQTLNTWYNGLVNPTINRFYECKYHHPFSAMEEMADIAGFYKAFGVFVEAERPDYLSMELEFMRLLALKEAKATVISDMENREICHNAQKKFLESHLGRWTATLVKVTGQTKFYAPLSRFLHEWITRECEFSGVTPGELYWSYKDENEETTEYKCSAIEEGCKDEKI